MIFSTRASRDSAPRASRPFSSKFGQDTRPHRSGTNSDGWDVKVECNLKSLVALGICDDITSLLELHQNYQEPYKLHLVPGATDGDRGDVANMFENTDDDDETVVMSEHFKEVMHGKRIAAIRNTYDCGEISSINRFNPERNYDLIRKFLNVSILPLVN